MTDPGGRPTLSAGDSGEWVLDLQYRLQSLGLFLGSVDGGLGERTVAAVQEFALVHHVTADSQFDPQVVVGVQIWTELLHHTEPSPADAYAAVPEDDRWVWHDGAVQPAEAQVDHVSPDGHWRWVDDHWQPNR